MTAPAHIGQVLSARARLEPTRTGIRDLERQMTFLEWDRRVNRLSNALTGIGLRKGDRLAVLAYNRIEWAEIYLAAAKTGIIAVPINFRLTGQEAAFILNDVEASALIVEEALLSTADSLRPLVDLPESRFIRLGGSAPAAGYTDYEALLEAATDRDPGPQAGPDDVWSIMYTSGTTGNPKGAIRDHGSTVRLTLMTATELSIVRSDDAFLVMPMCHANSLYFFASFIYCGATASIYSRSSFDPELCLRTMATQGSTFTSLVPTHYTMLLDAPAAARGQSGFKRVSKLMISSAPARAKTKRAVMEMFPNSGLFELYGSTEAGWATMLHPHEQFDKLGTVGREVVGSQPILLLDEDRNEVPDGQPGELFSGGPSNFSGYWRLPEKTAEAFHGDHLSVGDMAIRDADGYIRLVDRKNNMIISGGENIYPSEVEVALAAHPAVSDVAVIGRPDPKWGETVHAVIIRREGQSVTCEDLTAWARDRLAGFKRPRTITFIEPQDMPRNATGKILHRLLREKLRQDSPGQPANDP
jgi:acyl-CoA synthetase (AMP-forming)/AMP-acid ligase II